jgi:hypothetical protein
MRMGIETQHAREESFAVKMFAEHSPLGLGSVCQLLPHRAISVHAGRSLDQLPYCD